MSRVVGKWGAAGRNKCRDVFAVWSSNVWGSTLAQWTTADLLLNILDMFLRFRDPAAVCMINLTWSCGSRRVHMVHLD